MVLSGHLQVSEHELRNYIQGIKNKEAEAEAAKKRADAEQAAAKSSPRSHHQRGPGWPRNVSGDDWRPLWDRHTELPAATSRPVTVTAASPRPGTGRATASGADPFAAGMMSPGSPWVSTDGLGGGGGSLGAGPSTMQQRSMMSTTSTFGGKSSFTEMGESTLHSTTLKPPKISAGRDHSTPIRLAEIPRQDTIPCPQTGKRCVTALDDKIRIYVYLPASGDKLAFWVDPEMKMGPEPSEKNIMTDIWGDDYAENGPMRGRSDYPLGLKDAWAWAYDDGVKERHPGSPTSPLEMAKGFTSLMNLKKRESAVKALQRVKDEGTGLLGRLKAAVNVVKADVRDKIVHADDTNLKGLIMKTCGIPVGQQMLLCGRRRIESNTNTLRQYGIGHGTTVLLYVKKEVSDKDHRHSGKQIFLATTAAKNRKLHGGSFLAGRLEKSASNNKAGQPNWVIPAWHHDHCPKVIGTVGKKSGGDALFSITKPQYHDYSFMNDVGHFGGVGLEKLRGAFGLQGMAFDQSIAGKK